MAKVTETDDAQWAAEKVKKVAAQAGDAGGSAASSSGSGSGSGSTSGSTPSSGGGGGNASNPGSFGGEGGSSGGGKVEQAVKIVSAICALVATVGAIYWYTHDTQPERAAIQKASIDKEKAVDLAKARVEEEKQITARERIKERAAVRSQANTPPSSSQPASIDSFSPGKRKMIGDCGRKLVPNIVYKPDPGCFYFDNNDGTSNKTFQLWSGTSIRKIVPEYEDRAGVTIVAFDGSRFDGSRCESNVSDTCSAWIREHSVRYEGYFKFEVIVPARQGLMAHFNID